MFCLFLKAQLSQALEELGSHKQRADTVSPCPMPHVCASSRKKPALGLLRFDAGNMYFSFTSLQNAKDFPGTFCQNLEAQPPRPANDYPLPP